MLLTLRSIPIPRSPTASSVTPLPAIRFPGLRSTVALTNAILGPGGFCPPGLATARSSVMLRGCHTIVVFWGDVLFWTWFSDVASRMMVSTRSISDGLAKTAHKGMIKRSTKSLSVTLTRHGVGFVKGAASTNLIARSVTKLTELKGFLHIKVNQYQAMTKYQHCIFNNHHYILIFTPPHYTSSSGHPHTTPHSKTRHNANWLL